MRTTLRQWLTDAKFDWKAGHVSMVSMAGKEGPENVVLTEDEDILDIDFDPHYGEGNRSECPAFAGEDLSRIYFSLSFHGESRLIVFPKANVGVFHIGFLNLITPEGQQKQMKLNPAVDILVMPKVPVPNQPVYAGWMEAHVFMIGPSMEGAVQSLGQRMTLDYLYATEKDPKKDPYSRYIRHLFKKHNPEIVELPGPRIIKPGDPDFPANAVPPDHSKLH
jgi:hypothetical protein